MRTQKLFLVASIIVLFSVLGIGCRGKGPTVASLPKVNLTYWTVFDTPDDFSSTIAAYHVLHPNVTVTVKKVPFASYRKELVDAWARGEGPDLFSVPNTAMGTMKDFITPLPASLTLPTLVTSGGCTKDTKLVQTPKTTLTPESIDTLFIPTVADDVVFKNSIYGLPLAADTLALYYNKDLLNAANIVTPPQTWQEFVDVIDSTKSSLTKEQNGQLLQSGAALGTADNVERSMDILAALMMQSGAQMTDALGQSVAFQNPSAKERDYHPGVQALTFYTAFANPGRVTYTWNDQQPNAQEAFASGKVGFFVGYQYQRDLIKQQNPALNFGIAPLPQISLNGPDVNYANYWAESVSKQSKNPNEAWDFLLFSTTDTTQVKAYLTKTKKPTALRSELAEQKNSVDLGVFANDLLVAKNWYHGNDDTIMETSMKDMIRDTLQGTTPQDALNVAAQKIQQTLKP